MPVAANDMHEIGIRKAAILVASLNQAAADLLLDQLPATYADRVRRAVMDVDRIDPDERRRVIDEFRRIGPMIPNACPPGIDLTAPPIDIQDPITIAEEVAAPFGFLQKTEEEKLSRVLADERPQTIALVLSHLPPERAGNVLARFVPMLQIEIVRRLIDLQNADPDTLRQIEQTLESQLSQQFDAKSGRLSGPDAVAKILAACPGEVVGGILDRLAEHDEELARRLGRRTVEFDELGRFDDATLLAVARSAEPEVLEAALLGSPPLLIERILCLISPDESQSLRYKLDCPGPIRLSDVEEARQRIAALAERMQYGKRSKTALAA